MGNTPEMFFSFRRKEHALLLVARFREFARVHAQTSLTKLRREKRMKNKQFYNFNVLFISCLLVVIFCCESNDSNYNSNH